MVILFRVETLCPAILLRTLLASLHNVASTLVLLTVTRPMILHSVANPRFPRDCVFTEPYALTHRSVAWVPQEDLRGRLPLQLLHCTTNPVNRNFVTTFNHLYHRSFLSTSHPWSSIVPSCQSANRLCSTSEISSPYCIPRPSQEAAAVLILETGRHMASALFTTFTTIAKTLYVDARILTTIRVEQCVVGSLDGHVMHSSTATLERLRAIVSSGFESLTVFWALHVSWQTRIRRFHAPYLNKTAA